MLFLNLRTDNSWIFFLLPSVLRILQVLPVYPTVCLQSPWLLPALPAPGTTGKWPFYGAAQFLGRAGEVKLWMEAEAFASLPPVLLPLSTLGWNGKLASYSKAEAPETILPLDPERSLEWQRGLGSRAPDLIHSLLPGQR